MSFRSPVKKEKKLPECSKLPQLKIIKTGLQNNADALPSKSPKKVSGSTPQCGGLPSTVNNPLPNTFRIKMGSILPIESVSQSVSLTI